MDALLIKKRRKHGVKVIILLKLVGRSSSSCRTGWVIFDLRIVGKMRSWTDKSGVVKILVEHMFSGYAYVQRISADLMYRREQ